MPVTYNLIASNTLSSSAASVTFSAIPNTYTDLVLRYSIRTDFAGTNVAQARVTFNGTTSGYSRTTLTGNGASASSARATSQANFEPEEGSPSASNTANTFGTTEIYIPNYLVSTNKAYGSFAVGENNTTSPVYMSVRAALWQNTSAITSITLTANAGNFVSGCAFFLYGIKNS